MSSRRRLLKAADDLDSAPREGADSDSPEGSRYVIVSDTLARDIAQLFRDTAEDM